MVGKQKFGSIFKDKQAVAKPGVDASAKSGTSGAARSKVSLSQAKSAKELGRRAASEGNWPEAVKQLLVAWEVFSDDLAILTVLSHALVQLGVREKAIEVLERTLQRHQPTPDICAIMLQMAVEMSMYEVAVKIGYVLIELDPKSPGHYVNLASALGGMEELDAGIDMLQNVIPLFPEHSDLWNVLGTLVQRRDGREQSKVFFHEAIRLDPNSFKAINNLAGAVTDIGERRELSAKAIELQPDHPEPHIIKGFCDMHFGDLRSGFEEYEWRLDARRRLGQSITYTHKVPRWDGSSLKGKSLFVTGEQGIGDEILFAMLIKRVYEEAEQLYIGCEPRLVSIFQRQFPKAVVAPSATQNKYGYIYRSFPEIELAIQNEGLEIDWAVPIASMPKYFWHSVEDIEEFPGGYLSAAPELSKSFGARIAAAGEGLKVGLSWRSGNVSGQRKSSYLSLEQWLPVLKTPGVQFFSLQYTDVSKECADFEQEHGIKIHQFEDVNMKQDIEANLAIIDNLGLVMGAPTSPLSYAASLGKTTWWLSELEPWWRFGFDEGRPKFLPQGRFFTQEGQPEPGWGEPVEKVRQALSDLLASHKG